MDVLRSALPAGTLSGAPKVRAMQIIDELEPVKRCSYGGAIGYLSWNGDLDTAIHIRTVVVKDGQIHVQAGGGTVADAKPAYEYNESVNKAQAVFRAVELACEQPDWAVSACASSSSTTTTPSPTTWSSTWASSGPRSRWSATTRRRSSELLERGADRLVVSPGPCTPGRGGDLGRGDPRLRRGRHAGARRLPRPPGDGRGLRRPRRPGRAGPRQGRRDRARRPHDLRRACRARWSPAATTRWSPTPTCPTSWS